MDDLFRQGDNLAPDEVFCLSRKSRCELQLLSVLGPLAQSDLTATYSDTLFCTDASPQAGAVISAPIGATATQELWRQGGQRGYYTRLQSPLSEIMHEKGLDPISTAHYEPRTSDPISSSYGIVAFPASASVLCAVPRPVHQCRATGKFSPLSVALLPSSGESRHDFIARCRPSCVAVYGREPNIGETVANFSAQYPFGLLTQMASGSARAKRGVVDSISASVRARSLEELDIHSSMVCTGPNTEELFQPRQWHEDPEWGRSSSFAISRVLQTTTPYIIGGGLYPGLLHVGSSRNRADGPTRNHSIDPPTKEVPKWLTELQAGRPKMFDAVVESSRIQKNPARWLRFLLMLAGDIEPNPGPRVPRVRPTEPRGPMDLSVGFAASTSERMAKCFSAFRAWVEEHAGVSWQSLESDLPGIVCALRGYGLFCFEAGYPRYLLVYAITAIQDYYPGTRVLMGQAWQIDKKWQIHKPGQCRAVLPPVVIRAAVCLAALWGWRCWVAGVLLAFSAMLHSSELLALFRRDLVFPRDVHFDSDSLFVRIRDPKTSRFARRQHGKIDDPLLIQFIEAVFGALPLDCRQGIYFFGSISHEEFLVKQCRVEETYTYIHKRYCMVLQNWCAPFLLAMAMLAGSAEDQKLVRSFMSLYFDRPDQGTGGQSPSGRFNFGLVRALLGRVAVFVKTLKPEGSGQQRPCKGMMTLSLNAYCSSHRECRGQRNATQHPGNCTLAGLSNSLNTTAERSCTGHFQDSMEAEGLFIKIASLEAQDVLEFQQINEMHQLLVLLSKELGERSQKVGNHTAALQPAYAPYSKNQSCNGSRLSSSERQEMNQFVQTLSSIINLFG